MLSTNTSLPISDEPSMVTMVFKVYYGISPLNSNKVIPTSLCCFQRQHSETCDIYYRTIYADTTVVTTTNWYVLSIKCECSTYLDYKIPCTVKLKSLIFHRKYISRTDVTHLDPKLTTFLSRGQHCMFYSPYPLYPGFYLCVTIVI